MSMSFMACELCKRVCESAGMHAHLCVHVLHALHVVKASECEGVGMHVKFILMQVQSM